ncbi:MAG: methylated-DNA--[protein]-cysteine S-methyltransferase, partial [Methanobacteriota archaeon]
MEEESGPVTYKVALAARPPGPLRALTQRHEDLIVDAYPVRPYLLVQCSGHDEALDDAREALGSASPVVHESRADGRMTLFLDAGDAEDPIVALPASRAAHVIPPVRWQGGEARLTLLLEDGTDLREIASLFPGGRLLSKRALANGAAREALGSPLLLPSLTAKQASALVAAFEAGYYEVPRRVTTEEIGGALGIARSTFQEHLNRAEQLVVRAMLPLVRMRAAAPEPASARARDEALAVYSRFSRELGLYIRLEVLGGRVSGVLLTRSPSKGADPSHPYLARILEHLRTGEGDLTDIPLHLEVTPFERQVLEFLRKIPRGRTITYGEIALRLGRPGAARAVGQAVARNPVPVVVVRPRGIFRRNSSTCRSNGVTSRWSGMSV